MIDKSKRNKKAGKHPSYKARGMSEETIVKKRKRDTEIASRPEQKKKRVECNKKNRELKKAGVSTAGKDVSHTKRGLVLKSTKANRGSKSDSAGDRRARGGKTKK